MAKRLSWGLGQEEKHAMILTSSVMYFIGWQANDDSRPPEGFSSRYSIVRRKRPPGLVLGVNWRDGEMKNGSKADV